MIEKLKCDKCLEENIEIFSSSKDIDGKTWKSISDVNERPEFGIQSGLV